MTTKIPLQKYFFSNIVFELIDLQSKLNQKPFHNDTHDEQTESNVRFPTVSTFNYCCNNLLRVTI